MGWKHWTKLGKVDTSTSTRVTCKSLNPAFELVTR